MTLRCKPGDLAVIVSTRGHGLGLDINRLLLGQIVRVVRLRPPPNGISCLVDLVWEFEESIRVEIKGETFIARGIGDECLQPIRDPGEDAQDETLTWLPSPSRERSVA